MADTPGKDSPSTDPKTQAASGPVKPPVLEGTARSTPGPKTAARTTPPPAGDPVKPEPAKPSAPPSAAPKETQSGQAASAGTPWLAGVLGGVIGLGAAYGLAWAGLWPAPAQTPTPADPRLAQFSTAIPELQTATNSLQGEVSTLGGRVSDLQSALAGLPAAQNAPDAPGAELAEQLAALSDRVEALSNAPAPAQDGEASARTTEALAALQEQLAQLQQEASAAEVRLAAAESQLSALTETASANQAADSQAAQLPLIFSGLETAFATGRDYEAELAALRRSWPDAAIPEAISAHAGEGLPSADSVAQQLNTVIPDMLAGRPVSADASWQDSAMDWARGIVAIRPAGEIEGDGPEAQIARLEAAVARRDFVAAQAALAALPPSMQAASGSVSVDISALAEAQSFLADLRKTALSDGGGA